MSSISGKPHCLVFDSGMGGLTVVRELELKGFGGKISYAADTGFFPYGDKSDDELIRRVPRLIRALVEAAQPDIFVIACNTASTLALEVTRAVVDIPVVGTVPAIKPAAKATQTGTIGILATPGTLRRAYTEALIHAFAQNCRVISHGSVRLVELAERLASGEVIEQSEVADEVAKLTGQMHGDEIDQIVLACTHFPLLADELRSCVDQSVGFIDSGEAIARRVMSLLGQTNGPANTGKVERGAVWTTGASPSLDRLIKAAGFRGFSDHQLIELAD